MTPMGTPFIASELAQQSFDIDDIGPYLLAWSWCAPFHGVGDLEGVTNDLPAICDGLSG